jgi:serine/threonine-protein kinase
MAVVWRATQHGDAGFARPVAVKQMHGHLAESRIYVDMFAEEARVLSSIASPNVAIIYDFAEERGEYFLVMEWIDGVDLGSYIHYHTQHAEKTRWDLVTAVGIGVMRALAAAHERRGPDGQLTPIVHRDVSPHNVLITSEGMVKLIDFGLSLARDRGKELTEPGIVKGKMSYLSPEIVGGQRPTPLSDQFAAGSVLWEALVGRKLFEGQTDYDVYKKLRDGQVQPLRPLRRDIPRELTAVVHRALSPNPSQRFASAREMAAQLSQVLRSHRAPKDLHHLLGRTAAEAREGLELGPRTGEVSNTTPVADLEIDRVDRAEREAEARARKRELTPATSRPRLRRDTAEDVGPAPAEAKRGLLHKLPFFWKR